MLYTGRETLYTGRETLYTGREILYTGRDVMVEKLLCTGRDILYTGRYYYVLVYRDRFNTDILHHLNDIFTLAIVMYLKIL